MTLIKYILMPVVCLSLLTAQVSAESKPLDKIEAVVNQEVILSSDIKRMRGDLQKRYQASGKKLPSGNKLTAQILDKLISNRLQLQIAKRVGLRIGDAQLQETLKQIVKKEGKTLDQYQNELLKNGQSYSAFVDSVRDELTVNQIRQIQVRRRIHISDQEVEQMVKRINEQGNKTTLYDFAHILLKVDKNSSAKQLKAVQEKAKQLVEKINAGADISQLATEFSQGPKSLEGGDWGWRTINEIPTIFADQLTNINPKKGEVIGPFRSELGIHIIKILGKKGAKNVMTEEVKARHILIKSNIILSDKKAKQLLEKYRQEIIDGTETFANLAKEHSQDTGSAVKGGDLGWADPNMYVPKFKKMALSLPIGEISQPFHTQYGWHLLQVMSKRKADTTKEAIKQKAYGIIFKRRFPAEAYAWMNKIRQEAYIKINNPNYIMSHNND